MEAMPEWPLAAIPSAGVLGLLVWLIVRIMRQSSGDRSQYNNDLRELREQHDEQIKALRDLYTTQIADLREQVSSLRIELGELRVELETERRARWSAEDIAAKYRRLAGDDHVEP